jgi:hypothetical protein
MLREIGIIDSDHIRAEIWKLSYLNLVPIKAMLGLNTEYHVGGVLLLPTKKCLWRLCVLAQRELLKQAKQYPRDTEFKSSKVADLYKEWTSLLWVHSWDQLGSQYIEMFKEDYDHKELEVSVERREQLGSQYIEMFKKDYNQGERRVRVEVKDNKAHVGVARTTEKTVFIVSSRGS